MNPNISSGQEAATSSQPGLFNMALLCGRSSVIYIYHRCKVLFICYLHDLALPGNLREVDRLKLWCNSFSHQTGADLLFLTSPSHMKATSIFCPFYAPHHLSQQSGQWAMGGFWRHDTPLVVEIAQAPTTRERVISTCWKPPLVWFPNQF